MELIGSGQEIVELSPSNERLASEVESVMHVDKANAAETGDVNVGVTLRPSFINGRLSTLVVKLIAEAAAAATPLLASCQSLVKLDFITGNMRHRAAFLAACRVRAKTRQSYKPPPKSVKTQPMMFEIKIFC